MTRKALPLFAILITLIGITAVANAQQRHEITSVAYVPFEFVTGNRIFPAGTYVFEMVTGVPQNDRSRRRSRRQKPGAHALRGSRDRRHSG